MAGRRLALLVAAVFGALVAPSAARAAYAPRLAIAIAPTDRPGAGIALTSTVTQAAGEEPTAKAVVHFPVGIGFDLAALQRVAACTPAQRDARACPDASRLGTAVADTPVAQLTGGVFLGQAATIYIVLRSPTLALLGLEPEPITGRTEFRPDGGTDTVLDELPTDVTATRFELALDPPPRSVLTVGARCGAYPFSGDFTARSGATASSSTNVTIAGCPARVSLGRVRLTPRRVVARRPAVLAYTLDRAATLEVTVRRAGRRRVLGRTRRFAPSGPGRVRVLTRLLTPGVYVVTIRARAGGTTVSRSLPLRVLPLRRP